MNAYATALLEYLPRPIRSEPQYTAALENFGELQTAYGAAPSRELGDLMEVCAMLIEHYEESMHPAPDMSAADMLRHLMDEAGVSQAELARDLGSSRGQISNILSGCRCRCHPRAGRREGRGLGGHRRRGATHPYPHGTEHWANPLLSSKGRVPSPTRQDDSDEDIDQDHPTIQFMLRNDTRPEPARAPDATCRVAGACSPERDPGR